MRSDVQSARAEVERIDRAMAGVGRPVPGFRELLERDAHRGYAARLEAWRLEHPHAEARWRALAAEAAAAEERLRALECAAAEEARAWSRLEALELGKRTLDGLRAGDATPALEGVRRWLQSSPRPWALALSGGPGCGKTVAAAFAAMRALASGKRAEWVKCTQASREPIFGDEAMARERRWRTAGLLVLDDVGAEFASDAWVATLASVLDARWDAEAPTVITTNLDADGLRLRLGGRTVDRLAQSGRFEACGELSLRRRSA